MRNHLPAQLFWRQTARFCQRRAARLCRQSIVLCLILALHAPLFHATAFAEVVTLKNGMRIEGSVGKLGSLDGNVLQGNAVGEVATKEIVIIDDELRPMLLGQVTEPTPD